MQQLRQAAAQVEEGQSIPLLAQQAVAAGKMVQQGLQLLPGPSQGCLRPTQPLPVPIGRIHIQQHAEKGDGAAPGGEDLGAEVDPTLRPVSPDEEEIVIHLGTLPGGVPQGLEKVLPLPGGGQGGEIPGIALQQFPPFPAGEAAHLPAEGQAPQSRTAQLQHCRCAGEQGLHLLGGVLLPAAPGIQDAGRQAVGGLVAGNGQGVAHGGGVGEGGGGAGEGHRLERAQVPQPLRGEQTGKALSREALRRQVHQGGSGAVEVPAGKIHHLPLAVGDDLRKQKGNLTVGERPGKAVQPSCHKTPPSFVMVPL